MTAPSQTPPTPSLEERLSAFGLNPREQEKVKLALPPVEALKTEYLGYLDRFAAKAKENTPELMPELVREVALRLPLLYSRSDAEGSLFAPFDQAAPVQGYRILLDIGKKDLQELFLKEKFLDPEYIGAGVSLSIWNELVSASEQYQTYLKTRRMTKPTAKERLLDNGRGMDFLENIAKSFITAGKLIDQSAFKENYLARTFALRAAARRFSQFEGKDVETEQEGKFYTKVVNYAAKGAALANKKGIPAAIDYFSGKDSSAQGFSRGAKALSLTAMAGLAAAVAYSVSLYQDRVELSGKLDKAQQEVSSLRESDVYSQLRSQTEENKKLTEKVGFYEAKDLCLQFRRLVEAKDKDQANNFGMQFANNYFGGCRTLSMAEFADNLCYMYQGEPDYPQVKQGLAENLTATFGFDAAKPIRLCPQK